jgi:hypothetical protein
VDVFDLEAVPPQDGDRDSDEDKMAAERGHRDIVELLAKVKSGPKISERLFEAVEEYAKANEELVRSYRIYAGHEAEGKVAVEISEKRIH